MNFLLRLNNLATLAWFINTVVIKPGRELNNIRKERALARAERAYMDHWYPQQGDSNERIHS